MKLLCFSQQNTFYYFPTKNYCAVLSSSDNHILLALAAAEGWTVYQTDIVQAFLHVKLDYVDIYIDLLLNICMTSMVYIRILSSSSSR